MIIFQIAALIISVIVLILYPIIDIKEKQKKIIKLIHLVAVKYPKYVHRLLTAPFVFY